MRPLLALALAAFSATPVLARDLPEIRQSGRLVVAARPTSTLIFSPGTEDLPGFSYELAVAFARSIDAEVDMVRVGSFRDYWQPAKPDGTPALLTEVDLYADILSVTPQRRETVDMIPFIENTEILVGASTTTAKSLEDLQGRRVAVVEGMSFQRVLETALSAAGIPFRREPAEVRGGVIVPKDHPAPDRSPTGPVRILLLPSCTCTTLMFFPNQLAMGSIDFFILDSLSLFHQLNISQSLRNAVRPLFPLSGEVGRLAFAVSRHAPELHAVLGDWMARYRESEGYRNMVERYIGLGYEEYRAFVREFPR